MPAVTACVLAVAAATVLGLGEPVAAQTPSCTGTAAVTEYLSATDERYGPDTDLTGLIADCELLLGAQSDLVGSGTDPLNWSTGLSMKGWAGDAEGWIGVGVGGNPPRVTSLEIHGNRSNDANYYGGLLSGEIPSALGGLTALTYLVLINHQFSGGIPSELGDLSNLNTLWLHGNGLTGEIPTEVCDLRASVGDFRVDNRLLTTGTASRNQLTGCVATGSDNDTPEVVESDNDTPEVVESDNDTPEVVESDNDTPEVIESDNDTPEVVESDNDTPEVIESDNEAPGTTVADGASNGGSSGYRVGTGSAGGGSGLDVGVATLVVADGWSPADVGTASVLAAREGGAVVYVAEGELPAGVERLLGDALPAEVLVVGGPAAVSRAVVDEIREASPGSEVRRVSGEGRVATAAAAARESLGGVAGGGVTFVVANGWSAADAGVAAALAAAGGGRAAVLYTGGDALAEESAALLREYPTEEVVLVGGVAAVSAAAEQQAREAAGEQASVSRVTGQDRVETAAAAARRVLGDPASAGGVTLVVANGWSAADVGVAAALAAVTDDAAVVYTAAGVLSGAAEAVIDEYEPVSVIIVGGRSAVSDEVRDAVAAAAPDGTGIERISGQDRTDTAVRAARHILEGN
ncbi:cell wall-binding repeat-containing protein [Candidatus Poriferisodalis sp.]|uniref:cell wall-binding repeat-containing protein n=1 Tax=Candidatus Poriferisodalis sp. TaxID=3101277 RepID=UPI003B017AF8